MSGEMWIQQPRRRFIRKFARVIPYDLTLLTLYLFRSLQVRAWRDLVDEHVSRVGHVFTRCSGVAVGTAEFESWKNAYREHTWNFMPAHLGAIALCGAPRRVVSRIDKVGWTDTAEAFPPRCIVALSRTGPSIVIPWLLASGGLPVTVLAEPGGESRALLSASEKYPAVARYLSLIDGDAKALFAARRALRSGSRVLLYPEFGAHSQRLVRVDFLKGSRSVPLGCAALAWLCQAPIVPTCAYSMGTRRLVVEVGNIIEPRNFENMHDVNTELFSTLNRWVEQHCDQWVGWEYISQHEDTREGQ